MRWMDRLRARLRSLVQRGRIEQDLDVELRFHLDQQIAENLAVGMSPEDARVSALRSVGSVTFIKEQCRDSLGLRLIDEVRQDLRYAFLTLTRHPGYATGAIVSLGLGVAPCGPRRCMGTDSGEALLGGRPLFERIELIFGTSTGAIIAALLALGRSTAEIHALYRKHVPTVMQPKNSKANLQLLRCSLERFSRPRHSRT
jgi:Patatin-like phospholipase